MTSRLILSSLLAATIVATGSRAEAFELKHTADGDGVRWRVAGVSFTIDSSVRKVAGGEEGTAAAVAAWSERGGAPTLAVAAVGATVQPGLDGTNAVFFAEGGFAPAGNALAVTILSFDDRTGDVLDADIVFNGKYPLGTVVEEATHPTAVAGSEQAGYDIRRVVAHEMGHALGLSDELGQKTALMYPYVPRGVALSSSPSDDDVAGLTSLYGSVASANLSQATVTEQPATTAQAASGCAVVASPRLRMPRGEARSYLAAGLGLAGLAMSRRARAARIRRGAARCTALAATALFAMPASSSVAHEHREVPVAEGARATVTRVHTTSVGGLFRSEVDVETTSCASNDCPGSSRFVTWGGTVDHVRQVVGDAYVPEPGESVGLVLDQRVVRGISRLEQD